MEPITQPFTASGSVTLPGSAPQKLPLPTAPSTCELIERALRTCTRRELDGEFCRAVRRVHRNKCVDQGEN